MMIRSRFAAAANLLGAFVSTVLGAQTMSRRDTSSVFHSPATPRSAQNPAYSPDGRQILFTLFHNGYNKGPAGLVIVSRSSGEVTALLDRPAEDNVNLPGSSWNAARELIAFASDREGGHEIWTINPRNGVLSRVTRSVDGGESIEPSFSPDGEWIVFEVTKPRTGGDERFGALWKVRTDGSEVTRLTGASPSQWDDRQPNWSPRGDRIVFQRRPIGGDVWGLYTMSPNGSDLSPLLVSAFDHSDAAWSPDGRKVVFSSNHGGLSNPQIFVITSDGRELVRVTFDLSYSDSAPSWSPDRGKILFESHTTDGSPASLWEITAPDSRTRQRAIRH